MYGGLVRLLNVPLIKTMFTELILIKYPNQKAISIYFYLSLTDDITQNY